MLVIYSCIGVSSPFYVVYFMPAWFEGWQICVDTTLIIKFAYICLHVNMMRIGGCVNADMWPVFWLILFLFIFDLGRYVPEYSSDSNASQELKKKQAEVPHMIELSLRNVKGYKLVHARIECRIVWVVSRYTCHFKRILSVFRLQPLLHLCHLC